GPRLCDRRRAECRRRVVRPRARRRGRQQVPARRARRGAEPGRRGRVRRVRHRPDRAVDPRGARLRDTRVLTTMSAVVAGARPRSGSGVGGVPAWLVVPAFVGIAFLLLPLTALVGRADWSTLWTDIVSPATLE